MEPMKNLCGLIPESLHKRLMEGKSPEMTNGEYLTKILTTYLDQPATAKQEQRTLAVQISDDMFQRLKSYLDAHAPLTQKALVQSLLNQALDQWEHGEEPLQSAVLQDNKKERTLAIAMPESLFHRVEQYVEAHNGVRRDVACHISTSQRTKNSVPTPLTWWSSCAGRERNSSPPARTNASPQITVLLCMGMSGMIMLQKGVAMQSPLSKISTA